MPVQDQSEMKSNPVSIESPVGKSKDRNFFLLSKHKVELLEVNITSSLQASGIKGEVWNQCIYRSEDYKE